ncbi:uncharacterized protein LOC119341180 [Triticum dicoccoides]|uniref:uncharacterized protein LOC119341180 n=1 Tax=Triticum dicoccoides TaxID=85692 RepID=UPI001891E3A4|nr:uncharacterized protein LOC119341180 [Triticum dicoccoides]
MHRIRCATQRLKVVLQRSAMKGGCLPPSPCLCESLNWRSQTVSLPALQEVEINGFEGEANGTDFLKLILKCAPMLKRIIVKLSLEASARNDGLAKICNIFKAHSSVECDVYHSSVFSMEIMPFCLAFVVEFIS